MRHTRAVVCTMVVLVLLTLMVSPAAARPFRKDGPSVNRVKIVEMMVEAGKLATEGAKLRQEAVAGKVPDKSRPRNVEGGKGEKWIILTTQQRLQRFAQARSKYLAAVAKAAEAEAFLKSHPGVALEEAPATAKKRLAEQYALTIVAEARFRMAEEIGTTSQWKKLAAQALAADKDSLEAQRLVEEIKQYEKAQREAKADKEKGDQKEDDADDEDGADK